MTFPSSLRSGISFLQPRARRISLLLALLIGLAFLSRFTTFRTKLVFTNQDGRLALTANGKTIQGVGRIDRIDRIAIRVFNSVFPMGGETLRIWQDGRIVFEDELPDRFRVTRGAYAPLGDWSIDPFAGSGNVYERELPLTGDFTLEATFKGRCTEWTSVVLQGTPAVALQFRRGLLNNDFALKVGGRLLALDVLTSPLPQMALNALDIVLRALMAGCALVLLFTFVRWLAAPSATHPLRRFLRAPIGFLKRHWVTAAVGLVVLVALFGRLSVSEKILEGLAHTPDEVSYLLQSKWLVANRLYQPASPIQEHLAVPFTYVRDGKWFSMYPIGWPLLLAIGEAAGLPQIVSPVLGAFYVLVVFLIGKELYGKLVGLAAALLAALSPMAVLMSASYLSHSPAALTIALFLWLFLVARRRRSLTLFGLSGASLGYAFGIRPMTAVAIAVPFAILVVWELARSSDRPLLLRSNAAFAVGFVIGSLPVLIANHLITGSALSFAYSYGAGVSFSLKSLPTGLMYLDATTASVLPAIFGWGWGILSGWPVLSLSLAFACVPFLIRRPGRFEVLLGGMFLVLPLSFLAWGFHGLHGYGPRFYFEAFLGIYLLTARGFFLLGGIDSERGASSFRWGRGVALLSMGLLLLLVLSTALTLPSRMRLYRGYNFVSSALEAAISRQKIHRALILFPDDSWFPWGAASNLLPADLHGDLAFGVSRPDNSKLAAFYPDRPAYLWFGNLTPMRLPSGVPPLPPESRRAPPGLTTLLGWWIALSAAAVGLFIAVARGSTRPSDSGFPPDPLRPAKRLRDLVRPRSVRLRVLPRHRAWVGLLAVLVAYAGQTILVPSWLTHRLSLPGISSGSWFHVGWILLTLGAVVFAVAWRGIDPGELESAATSGNDGPVSKYEPVSATEVEPSRPETGFGRAGRILGTVSLLLCLYNDWDWAQHGESSRTRSLWGVSIVLFLSALALFRGPAERPARRDDDLPRLPATLLLALITGIAFFLRFVDLANVPFDVHGDFASIGLGARDILQGRVPALFATGWAGLPWAAYLPAALGMKVFGDSLFGMNMEAVIAGTATVIGIYCLGSLLLNRSIALLAASVSAVGYTDIHFSRVSAYIDPVPWMVFGIYFLMRGLRSGKALWFGLSGVLLSIGFEMYFSGRLAVIVLILFFGYLAVFHRAVLRSRWEGLVFLVIAGVVAMGPMLLFHWRFSDTFMGRTREVYAFTSGNLKHLLNKYNTDSPTRVFVEQVWRSLLTFNYTPDSSTQFGFRHSMVNPALAPLFVLGTGLGVARLRRPGYALLFIWLAAGIVVGSILTIDSPFWPRLVILLPVVAILTAVGLYTAVHAALALVARRSRSWLALLPAAGVLALVGHQNWQWYFHDGPRTHVAPIALVGRVIAQSPPGTAFCMIRGPLDFADRVPQFLAKGHAMLDFPREQLEENIPRCLGERRVWVIIPPDHDAVLALLNRRWPGARQEQHNFPGGQPGPIFWYPPASASDGGTTP